MVSLTLALAVVLSSLPATRELFGRVSMAFAAPTPTSNIQLVSGITFEPSTIAIEGATPPPLGPAPTSCPQKAAKPRYV
ncbi:MAG TPA: hypothetical protein VGP82_20805 [Ktedonobacterales bacterium]|nr:hypothetical protein [Ktedonobacterales bacterium]